MQDDLNIFLALQDDVSAKLVYDYIQPYENYVRDCDVNDLLAKICTSSKNMKSIVVIDVDEDRDNIFALIKKIKQTEKLVKVAVLSTDVSAKFAIDAIRNGVDEIIQKPVLKQPFLEILNKMSSELAQNNAQLSRSKVISVFSNKGGLGKTAIAVNLGVEIAKLSKKKVAIIDLNLQLGDVTTFLDLNPTFDISYMMKNQNIWSEEFLLSSMQQYKDTSLYVLAEPAFAEQSNDISGEQIVQLINKMKETFSYIIIDTGSAFDDKTLSALEISNIVLLCAIVNLPVIRNCQRCLDLFERFGYNKEKIKIVLNRYMENDEIKTEDVEKVLNKKVWWKIPNNYITMISSVNKGIPVSELNSEANIAQNFKEFASKLTDGFEYINIAKNK